MSSQCNLPYVRPQFRQLIYRISIQGGLLLNKFHRTGTLILTRLPYETFSTRVVFTDDSGRAGFDFGWYPARVTLPHRHAVCDSFVVHHMARWLQRRAITQTLRRDIEMVLGEFDNRGYYTKGDTDYFKTAMQGDHRAWAVFHRSYLQRVELPGGFQPKVTYYPKGIRNKEVVDSITIVHHRDGYQITAIRD